MKCPKCGFQMKRNYCMHCGFMKNGRIITKEGTNPKALDAEIYLGERFDTICHNDNTRLIFLLGPFYFCYNKLFFLGVSCVLLDFLIVMAFSYMPIEFGFLKLIFAFLTDRVIYMTFSNIIYLKILNKRIEKLKKKYPDNYTEILQSKSDSTKSIPLLILGVLIGSVTLLIIFLLLNK